MTVQTTPNTKYAKGVRWLAELVEKKQVSSLTAQTLNKAAELSMRSAKHRRNERKLKRC
jgi:cell division inhibitor SulA